MHIEEQGQYCIESTWFENKLQHNYVVAHQLHLVSILHMHDVVELKQDDAQSKHV